VPVPETDPFYASADKWQPTASYCPSASGSSSGKFRRAYLQRTFSARSSQALTVLVPVSTVGVMGDERSYENVIAIRCVDTTDFMTADFSHIPYEVLGTISSRIINEVRGVKRCQFRGVQGLPVPSRRCYRRLVIHIVTFRPQQVHPALVIRNRRASDGLMGVRDPDDVPPAHGGLRYWPSITARSRMPGPCQATATLSPYVDSAWRT